MAGTAHAVSNGPSIARKPAVLCLRISITLGIPGPLQRDHIMNIAMAVHKGAACALIGH